MFTKHLMFAALPLTFSVCIGDTLAASPQDELTETKATQAADGPPFPGPELLKYTPEQIEAAYEGKRMPEAVAMYLVIARGGQMDGTAGWFNPAANRFSWEWLAEQNGSEPDKPIAKDKFKGDENIFSQLDRDRDDSISGSDLDWSDSNPWVRQSYMIGRMFRRIDPSGDGKLTADEWQTFFEKIAGDGDTIRSEQLRDALIPPGSGFSPGDMPSKETLIKGLMAGEIGSLQEGPNIDEVAPDFELRPLGGGEPIRLSDRIGRKPMVLVFGNFTCGPFRSTYPAVEAVRERQKDNADFLMVYVREAHPTDGWAMKSNDKVGVSVAQPTTFEERQTVAEQCAAKLNPSMPLLIDDIDDTVGNAYSGMPARLYVIDTNGRVAYKSGRGPFGFKPEEMEQALLMLTLEEASKKAAVAIPDDAEAWKLLPKAISGSGQPLPSWARAVATQLPRTAAAMLELDFSHRTKSPIDPILRAKMRWVIANANQCEYSKTYAVADLKRAGATDADLTALAKDPATWPEAERKPLEFARLLTVAALNGAFQGRVEQSVNYVNAPLIAAERGIEVIEERRHAAADFTNLVRVTVRADGEEVEVSGTTIGADDRRFLASAFGLAIDIQLSPRMVFLRYDDLPGVIGRVGTMFGDAGVNIANMAVSRTKEGGKALMALSVDSPVSAELVERVRGEGFDDARFITLD